METMSSAQPQAGMRNVVGLWRQWLLLLILLGPLVLLAIPGPLRQSLHYHAFADGRAFLGIPNFVDVASNLPFLIVGVAGLWLGLRGRFKGMAAAWMVFFAGVGLVSAGSAWYHLQPNNDRLVWDRLPMTIGFMAVLVAVLGESGYERLGKCLLVPALLIGIASVMCWRWFDDLRLYAWVQYVSLLAILILVALFPSRYSHRHFLWWALLCYVLAKLFEVCDSQLFALTNHFIGGHALKHVLAAMGCLLILEMLRRRSAGLELNSEGVNSGITLFQS